MVADLSKYPLILIAGGKSSRLGFPKGLMQVQGKPWVLRQIEAFKKIGGRRVILVLGYDADAYSALDLSGVETVLNSAPEHGPFTSIQTGARVALEKGGTVGDCKGEDCKGAFVLPIDVPVAKQSTWLQLIQALHSNVRVCQPIYRDGDKERGGHPALLSKAELSHLLGLPQTGRLDVRIHELASSELARVLVNDRSVLLNLNSPEDWVNFMEETSDAEVIGKSAAILSVVEVGLGSILHSAHVPTSGHWLSLNQSFWLSRASFQIRPTGFAPLTISNVTASLKTLSPAGKKLTPMLAISAQGAIFNLGTLIAGGGIVGASLGSALASVWAFVQPVAIYYVIFGSSVIDAALSLLKKTQEVFHFSDEAALQMVIVVICAKAFLAVILALVAYWIPQKRLDDYQSKLERAAQRAKGSRVKAPESSLSAARLALRDLFNPLFFVSLALTFAFFVWSESSRAQLVWALVRPIAVGFLLFYGVRVLPTNRILAALEKRGFSRFAHALRIAKGSVAVTPFEKG